MRGIEASPSPSHTPSSAPPERLPPTPAPGSPDVFENARPLPPAQPHAPLPSQSMHRSMKESIKDDITSLEKFNPTDINSSMVIFSGLFDPSNLAKSATSLDDKVQLRKHLEDVHRENSNLLSKNGFFKTLFPSKEVKTALKDQKNIRQYRTQLDKFIDEGIKTQVDNLKQKPNTFANVTLANSLGELISARKPMTWSEKISSFFGNFFNMEGSIKQLGTLRSQLLKNAASGEGKL